jgi:hypothetical protein
MKVLDETSLEKVIVSIQHVNYGSVIAIVYSDGSVEFRNRTNMDLLVPDEDQDKVSSMTQVGFRFPYGDPGKLSVFADVQYADRRSYICSNVSKSLCYLHHGCRRAKQPSITRTSDTGAWRI